MNFRWTVVLSLVALALFGWFYEQNHTEEENPTFSHNSNAPTYIGEGMSAKVFNEQGHLKYIANAKKVTYFEGQDKTYFQYPQLFVFDKEKANIKEWEMNADEAILNNKNDTLLLTNDVKIQSLIVNNQLQQLLASKLKINLTTKDVSSNEKVTIIGQDFTTSGLELVGNLNTQFATLKKQVTTHYDKHEK